MQTKSDQSREAILKSIAIAKQERKSFNYPEPDWEEPIYKKIEGSLEDCFAAELKLLNGNSELCSSEDELYENIKKLLDRKGITRLFCRTKDIADKLQKHNICFFDGQADFLEMEAGITFCEALVARTGSVLVSAAHEAGRQMNAYPPVHIVVARKSQLLPYMSDGLAFLKEKYNGKLPSTITSITGPSRTADIEKTLVLGAHGPKEFWVFMY